MDAKRNQDREPCRLRLLGHKLQMQCVLRTDKWVYVVSQLINAPFFLTLYSKTCPLTKGACMSSNLIYLMQVYLSPGAIASSSDDAHWLLWSLKDREGYWGVDRPTLLPFLPACGDIWYRGTHTALFPFNLSDLKCKHPHRCTLDPFRLLPVISP